MASILALETSGTLCSVALDRDGNCFELTQHVERRHNELLLGMIDQLCIDCGLALEELDAVAFGCGPGSFTGVRIAAAAVQGIALVLDVPVLPVPSSQVLARGWLARNSDILTASGNLVTSIRSRSHLYYLAAYSSDEGSFRELHGDGLHESMESVRWIADLSDPCFMVGERPDWWTGPGFEHPCQATAADVAALARERWHQVGGLDAAAALPLYVTGDSPWRRVGAIDPEK